MDIANGNGVDYADVVGRLKKNNRVGAGATLELLNFGYRWNNDEPNKKHNWGNKVRCPGDYGVEEKLSISFGIADRVEANLRYPGDLFSLAFNGNAQFAGETITMKPVVNAFYVREYTVGAAMPLPVYLKHWDFRGEIRVKYLQGIAGAYTNRAHLSMFTEEDGRYITAGWDYKVNAAYMEAFSPFKGTGRGLGTDVGITAHYNTRWYGNVNLLDLGFVRFRSSAHSFEDEEEYKFEGIVVDNIFQDDLDINTEELEELIETNDNTGTPFTMPYPLRFRSHLSYRIPATSPEGDLYHKHSFSATYIQGMYDLGNATRIPYFAVAYDFSFRDHFEAGTNLGFSGFNRLEIGAFAAFRVGAFRFGAGSGNFTALLFPNYGSGADLSMNMTTSF